MSRLHAFKTFETVIIVYVSNVIFNVYRLELLFFVHLFCFFLFICFHCVHYTFERTVYSHQHWAHTTNVFDINYYCYVRNNHILFMFRNRSAATKQFQTIHQICVLSVKAVHTKWWCRRSYSLTYFGLYIEIDWSPLCTMINQCFLFSHYSHFSCTPSLVNFRTFIWEFSLKIDNTS